MRRLHGILIFFVISTIGAAWAITAPSEPLPEPVYLVTRVTVPVYVDPVPVSHLRPAIVEHTVAYLELKRSYLETGEYVDPDVLAATREKAREDLDAEIHITVQRRPPAFIAPPAIETLVRTYFAEVDVQWAINVIKCESGFDANAKNPRSTASGLFQHLASYWDGRSEKAGWGGASIWDPEANVAVAAWLVYHGGGWSHWDASRYCWG